MGGRNQPPPSASFFVKKIGKRLFSIYIIDFPFPYKLYIILNKNCSLNIEKFVPNLVTMIPTN